MAFGIDYGDAHSMVGVILDGRHFSKPFAIKIFPQRDNVVGGEGHVVHPVGGVGIGCGAIADPLPADHEAHNSAGLHRRAEARPSMPV